MKKLFYILLLLTTALLFTGTLFAQNSAERSFEEERIAGTELAKEDFSYLSEKAKSYLVRFYDLRNQTFDKDPLKNYSIIRAKQQEVMDEARADANLSELDIDVLKKIEIAELYLGPIIEKLNGIMEEEDPDKKAQAYVSFKQGLNEAFENSDFEERFSEYDKSMLIRIVNGWTTSTAHITYFRHRSELQRMCYLEYFRIKHPGNSYDEKNLVNLYETSLDDEWLPPYLKPVEEIPYRFVDKTARFDLAIASLSKDLSDAQLRFAENEMAKVQQIILSVVFNSNIKNTKRISRKKASAQKTKEIIFICDYVIEFLKSSSYMNEQAKQEKIENLEKVKGLAEKLQSGKKLTEEEMESLSIK